MLKHSTGVILQDASRQTNCTQIAASHSNDVGEQASLIVVAGIVPGMILFAMVCVGVSRLCSYLEKVQNIKGRAFNVNVSNPDILLVSVVS